MSNHPNRIVVPILPRTHLLFSDIFDIAKRCRYEDLLEWTELRASLDEVETSVRVARCQEWLFFGPLWVVAKLVDKPLSLATFLEDGASVDTQHVLNTNHLSNWFREIQLAIAILRNQSRKRFEKLKKQYMTILEFLHGQLQWVTDTLVRLEGVSDDMQYNKLFNVIWATLIVHEEMKMPFAFLWPSLETMATRLCMERFARSRGIVQAFSKAGRCPTVARRLVVSPLDAWLLCKELLPSYASGDHKDCVDRQCFVYNTANKADYIMEHAIGCLGCIEQNIDLSALEALIIEDKIPLVQSKIDTSGICNLAVVDGSLRNDYVAISHVWAGGLGNFNANGHYECQLSRIHTAITDSGPLRQDAYYWFDTLCIPIGNAGLKRKAINNMARIYAGARSVLVVDPILQTIDANGLSPYSLALEIAASPWMTRSWTLQEGALGVKLSFEFRDKIVQLDEVELNSGPLKGSLIQALWKRDVDLLEDDWYSDEAPRSVLDGWNELDIVWRNLCDRNTMEAQDLAGILAVFMDRRASDVINLSPEEQVYVLLQSQKEIPIYLLFAPVFPRKDYWLPIMPRSSAPAGYIYKSGILLFDDKGFLTTSKLHDFYILRSTESIQLSQDLTLCLSAENKHFALQFDKIDDAMMSLGRLLFILPRWAVFVEGIENGFGQEHTGFCCQILTEVGTSEHTHARYVSHFRWNAISSAEWELDNSSNDCDVSIFLGNGSTDTSTSHTLTFDMGMQPRAGLKWSRSNYYHYIDNSLRTAQSMRLIWTANTIFTRILFLQMFVWLTITIFGGPQYGEDNSAWKIIFKVVLGFATLAVLYFIHLIAVNSETSRFSKLSRERLQRVWALSFSSDTTLAMTHADRFQSQQIIGFTTIYYLIFLILMSLAPANLRSPWRQPDAPFPWFLKIAPIDVLLDSAHYGHAVVAATRPLYWYMLLELVLRLTTIGIFILQSHGFNLFPSRHRKRTGLGAGTRFDLRNRFSLSYEFSLAGLLFFFGSGAFAFFTIHFSQGREGMPLVGWIVIMITMSLATIGFFVVALWHFKIGLVDRTGMHLSF